MGKIKEFLSWLCKCMEDLRENANRSERLQSYIADRADQMVQMQAQIMTDVGVNNTQLETIIEVMGHTRRDHNAQELQLLASIAGSLVSINEKLEKLMPEQKEAENHGQD